MCPWGLHHKSQIRLMEKKKWQETGSLLKQKKGDLAAVHNSLLFNYPSCHFPSGALYGFLIRAGRQLLYRAPVSPLHHFCHQLCLVPNVQPGGPPHPTTELLWCEPTWGRWDWPVALTLFTLFYAARLYFKMNQRHISKTFLCILPFSDSLTELRLRLE